MPEFVKNTENNIILIWSRWLTMHQKTTSCLLTGKMTKYNGFHFINSFFHLTNPPETKGSDIITCYWISDYLYNARTVGANESCLVLPNQAVFDTHHILLRDALSNTHHQANLCINCFQNGCCRKGGWHKNHSGSSTRFFNCLRKENKKHTMVSIFICWHFLLNAA